MKIIVNRESFTKAFRQVFNAVPTHSTKDVLKYVKVQAGTNKVDLIGSNSVVEMIVNVSDVEMSDTFDMFVPALLVMRILAEIDEEKIFFEFDDGAVFIHGAQKRWEFRLQTVDGGDFTRLKVDKPGCVYVLSAENVQAMIKRTIFAADVQSERYVLDGVRCEFEGHEVNFVATDTRRLSIAHAVCSVEGGEVDRRIVLAPPVIPQKAMKVILSILQPGRRHPFRLWKIRSLSNAGCAKSWQQFSAESSRTGGELSPSRCRFASRWLPALWQAQFVRQS